MARLSPASPFILEFSPRFKIESEAGQPVAVVDTVHRLASGFRAIKLSEKIAGLGAAFPETPVRPKRSIIDEDGNVVAIVEGVFQVFDRFRVRPVTAAEAALS